MIYGILFGGVVVAAVACICGAIAYNISQSRHGTLNEASPASRIDETGERILGDCAYCRGTVSLGNGLLLKCRHAIHFTCSWIIKQTIGNGQNEVCIICLNERLNSTQPESDGGLRRRRINDPICVNCLKDITHDPKTLLCSHQVHQDCWARMEEASLTTCPECMKGQ